MKALYILIALALFAGAYFFYTQNATAPTAEDVEVTDEEQADMDMGDSVEGEEASVDSMGMPVPEEGNENVDEMIVTDEMDASEPKVFVLTGENFAFSISEIKVKEGDTVTINFSSADGFHDWVVDEFDAATDQVQTGGQSSVTFVADKAGTYEYYCSVGQHRANGMVGTLIVE